MSLYDSLSNKLAQLSFEEKNDFAKFYKCFDEVREEEYNYIQLTKEEQEVEESQLHYELGEKMIKMAQTKIELFDKIKEVIQQFADKDDTEITEVQDTEIQNIDEQSTS